MKAGIPIVVGVIPFGFIFGILALEAGLSPWMAWSTSSIIFAGSAQFLAMPLIEAGTPSLILIMTAFIINLRHVLYSATLAPFAEHLPLRWKIGLSYLLTDESFAPTVLHYKETEEEPLGNKHWFWFGVSLLMWVQWQISTGIGIFFGAQLPEIRGLEFTLSLTFIGMIAPYLKQKPCAQEETVESNLDNTHANQTHANSPLISPMWIAVVVAGIVALIAYPLPHQLGLLAAAIAGISTGVMSEQVFKSMSRHKR